MTKRFRFRWGIPEWDVGSTDIPNPIFQYYSQVPWVDKDGNADVGISNTEAMFILHLASYHYESKKGKASPSLTITLRKRMGYKTNQGIINVMEALEHKNLLAVKREAGKRSTYDFSNFSQAIWELWKADQSIKIDGSTKVDDHPSTKVDDHPSTKVDPKKKKEEGILKEEEDNSLFPKNSQPSSSSPFQKGDDFLEIARKSRATQEAAGGAVTVPPSGGGAFALGDRLITVACCRLGRLEPNGGERKKARLFFEKVLKSKELLQSDGALAVEAVKEWLDPKGDYAFFLPQYSLEASNKLAVRHLGIVLAKVMQQVRDEAAHHTELLEGYEEGDYEPVYMMPTPEQQPMTESEKIWRAALGELQLQMTKATFDTWVKDTRAISYEDGVFVIEAPNALAKDWLENRLLTTVERTLVGILGKPVEVRFISQTEG